MDTPREHGGMRVAAPMDGVDQTASMGPPREHGGMDVRALGGEKKTLLQWGRRVNTAE